MHTMYISVENFRDKKSEVSILNARKAYNICELHVSNSLIWAKSINGL